MSQMGNTKFQLCAQLRVCSQAGGILTSWKRKLYWYNKHRLSHPQVNPSVVYLSHDDGEGHGYILGKDFNTYLEQLLLVGACGNEDWQMLPFCLDAQSEIVSDCENAKEYRKLIGLQI